MIVGGRQDRRDVRLPSLVTPVNFDVAIGTSATTLYTGNDDFFVIKAITVVNPTGGSLTLSSITGGGNSWVTNTVINANTSVTEIGLAGQALAPNDDLEATGSATGLRAFGWGLRIKSGDGVWRV